MNHISFGDVLIIGLKKIGFWNIWLKKTDSGDPLPPSLVNTRTEILKFDFRMVIAATGLLNTHTHTHIHHAGCGGFAPCTGGGAVWKGFGGSLNILSVDCGRGSEKSPE